MILLPQTSKENALNVARRLHKLIRETVWLAEAGLNIRVTPSVGVASYPVDSRTKEGLLHLADEAMYLVKNTNRDSRGRGQHGNLARAGSQRRTSRISRIGFAGFARRAFRHFYTHPRKFA